MSDLSRQKNKQKNWDTIFKNNMTKISQTSFSNNTIENKKGKVFANHQAYSASASHPCLWRWWRDIQGTKRIRGTVWKQVNTFKETAKPDKNLICSVYFFFKSSALSVLMSNQLSESSTHFTLFTSARVQAIPYSGNCPVF